MSEYKLMVSGEFGEVKYIFKKEGNLCIPFDPSNTDYQAYLKWLEAGNVPIPAEEG
jgi:hypothetical protein